MIEDEKDGELCSAILARIDERLKNMNDKLRTHLSDSHDYFIKNDLDVRGLYKTQYIGYGIILAINFIILLIKR